VFALAGFLVQCASSTVCFERLQDTRPSFFAARFFNLTTTGWWRYTALTLLALASILLEFTSITMDSFAVVSKRCSYTFTSLLLATTLCFAGAYSGSTTLKEIHKGCFLIIFIFLIKFIFFFILIILIDKLFYFSVKLL